MHGQHIQFSTAIYFLDHDYHYKSVATKIPHNVGLALVCTAREWIQDQYVQDSDSASALQQQIKLQ